MSKRTASRVQQKIGYPPEPTYIRVRSTEYGYYQRLSFDPTSWLCGFPAAHPSSGITQDLALLFLPPLPCQLTLFRSDPELACLSERSRARVCQGIPTAIPLAQWANGAPGMSTVRVLLCTTKFDVLRNTWAAPRTDERRGKRV